MRPRTCILWGLSVLAVAVSGCEPDRDTPARKPVPPEAPKALEFPPDLRSDDDSVNAFIVHALDTCVEGDYEGFRLLWTADAEQFPRDRFEQAWRSVEHVTVVGLRPIRDARTGRLYYAVRAVIELAPEVHKPERDITLLIVKEDGQWHLTSPPETLPDNLFEIRPPTTAPASDRSEASGSEQ